MPPSIHPVDLIIALREKHLTPAIVFLTSRRACDEAMQAFDHSRILLPPPRQQAIATVLEKVIAQYPSIAEHPLIPTVQRIGVAAHHAGHLPSWKIAVEELMRHGCLDAVFKVMQERGGARCVGVVDPNKRLIGYITAENLAELVMIRSAREPTQAQAASTRA